MSNEVFISYSSQDSPIVKKITQTLNETGISYWKAPEMIPAGSNYAREIPRAIERCKVFLLLLSESSQQSIWVEKEIDCAINYRKTIVPLNLSGAPMSDMFRFYLNNVQTIHYNEDSGQAMQQLLERLKDLVGSGVEEEMPYRNSLSAATVKMELPPSPQRVLSKEHDYISRRERNNALKINQNPVVCKRCGGDMISVSLGVYQCADCGFEDYDSYRKIKNYLDKEGPKNITEIVRATGVPRSTVEYFLKEERFEIPLGSPMLLVCSGCGAGIRTGVLCDKCKSKKTAVSKEKYDTASYRFFNKDR